MREHAEIRLSLLRYIRERNRETTTNFRHKIERERYVVYSDRLQEYSTGSFDLAVC